MRVKLRRIKRCKRDTAQPRVEDAKRPKPWVGEEEGKSPARAMQQTCAALAGLNLYAALYPRVLEPASRALSPWALLLRAYSAGLA
jgi:hypothetical protein